MAKKMLIDATHAEETRVVVVDGNKVEEFDFESENRRQLAGNIYLAKVTRVEPSLQAAFVDYGGNRHGFLAFSEIHPDYYQIPVADREALLAEEEEYAEEIDEEEEKPKPRRRSRGGKAAAKAADAHSDDAVATADAPDDDAATADDGAADTPVAEADIPGMGVVDLDEGEDDHDDNGDPEANGDEGRDGKRRNGNGDVEGPYRAIDDAAERDSEIESVADEDVSDEIRRPRKPRRKYKIQEVIKVRQILLVQVVKEERGNKGAALTTYLSLAGRYCVLMPNTARGGGISRKITNVTDRKKLKTIAQSIDVPKGAGLIIRTAGAQRTKTEIKRDYEYLQRMWEQIRELTLQSIAPAKIYEEGDLIKRSIRDLYSREIDEVWVEGTEGYRTAKDFMKMIMPSHAKNVKNYQDQMPLFARYQVESYLSSMFNPVVQLRSGGYIVIGVTEALVAIDVNSGRATKKGSIEETALETNLEAAEEIARQLRLRDLAGLIVIDFIDMEERKNNAAVEKRFKDKLKTDRARIQVGKISAFGLLEMSRQRLRPGMLEATTQPCPSCHGTGLLRSDDNLALGILRQIEEEGTRRRTKEVLVKVPVGICNFLMNQKREHIAQIEARYGLSVRIEADPALIPPDFSLEKFKTATRVVEQTAPVISATASLMDDIDATVEEEPDEEEAQETATEAKPEPEAQDEAPQPKKRRRRRRRRGKGNGENGHEAQGHGTGDEAQTSQPSEGEAQPVDGQPADEPQPEQAEAQQASDEQGDEKPKRRRSRGGRKRKTPEAETAETQQPEEPKTEVVAESEDGTAGSAATDGVLAQTPEAAETPVQSSEPQPEPAEAKPAEPVAESEDAAGGAPTAPEVVAAEAASSDETTQEEVPAEAAAKPADPEQPSATPEPPVAAEQPAPQPAPQPETPREPALAEGEADEKPKPKRRGWWSLGR
ncbi:ribonuclease E/G [Tranquillimonas alkanivorans]|uniref:Ribonuclease E n=1 Tax=Tranquillimonas alkanivorans TaxID=441119 RepID=A0A1I5RCU8_9RHOB|nr:ribonuclease E/G [Tranquillimonas alkanivorans]SFP56157.1 RNAse E [Tranquillimonas alkanivorans]